MDLGGVVMAVLAMASVGLWTLRVALAARGARLLGACVSSVEAVVFACAFSNLVTNLDAPGRIVGYAIGVGLGTLGGMAVDQRVAGGTAVVQVVTPSGAPDLRVGLRSLGWPATALAGDGPRGPVQIAFVAVDADRVEALVADVARLAPDAFWTVQQLRDVHAPAVPAGFVQAGRPGLGATRRRRGADRS